MEAAQVSVVVIGARNLRSKKRDTCLASVVFGIGSDLFGTEVVDSNEPIWNQEANFDVSKKPHSVIKFKIRDKDNTIGAVHIPIDGMPTMRPGQTWYPVEPYKKITVVQGDLCVECWISKTQPISGKGSSMPNSRETSVEDFQSFVTSQVSHVTSQVTHLPGKVMDYLHLNKRSPSLSKSHHASKGSDSQASTPYSSNQSLRQSAEEEEMTSSRGSDLRQQTSDSNLVVGQKTGSSTPPLVTPAPPTEEPPQSDDTTTFAKIPLKEVKLELDKETQDEELPEVNGVSPNEGSIDGGTKVTLRGSYLGTGPEDILQVLLAGVDCTENVEYLSTSKLVVTTQHSNGKPTEGPVTIETRSGGVGVSTINFKFVKEEAKSDAPQHSRIPSLSSPFTGRKKAQEETELQSELKQMKNQLRELKDENLKLKDDNKSLQEYIDKLLLIVMDISPDALALHN